MAISTAEITTDRFRIFLLPTAKVSTIISTSTAMAAQMKGGTMAI